MSLDYAATTSAPYTGPSHFSHAAMADPNVQQQSRQQQAYPSPHSYPSPSMQSTYSYPPPQGQQNSEPYRESPQQGQNMSLPPLNLPPIRQLDGQQPPPPQPSQQPMGSPLPPPPHGLPPQYYPPPPNQQMMGNMGPAQYNAAMRYQLPPQHENRVLSGGRHKKEIKRRTKTGCLTCRKRRIKCDEAHPVCRNCQKSKRECLGYDPIFKQQPGPAQIQPAPNSTPAPHSSTPAPAPAPPAPASYSQSPVPQGYAPASSSGYAPAAPTTSGAHPQEGYNAIDPALAAPPGQGAQPGQPPYNGTHSMDPAMRGPPSAYAHPPPPPPEPTRGKRLRVDDIFGICNHNPPEVPARSTPIPPQVDDDFARIFVNDYCQGLDFMLQTNWFSTNNNALNRVFSNQQLHEEAAFFTETMQSKQGAADMSGVFGQEARLIWHLLATCKHSPPTTNGVHGSPNQAEGDDLAAKEVRARLEVLEALLTNGNVASNPLRQLSYPPDLQDNNKKAEIDFWLQLGEFVQFAGSDNAHPSAADHALSTMRGVLQVQEVRDAIYSIAIARHCGSRIGGFPNALPPSANPHEDSDLNKLLVAMSFISHESRSGSQQVLARICDMAMLSWTVARS